jgi:hypothetical protein
MRNLIIILSTAAMGWMAVSSMGCQSEYVLPEAVILPDTVSFELDVVPIFKNGCISAGCHTTGAITPDLTPANAYNNLIVGGYLNLTVPEQSELYLWMRGEGGRSPMPISGTIEANNAIVLKWIQEGAKDN